MSFETFSEFIEMGGHGLYVWLCYGVGLVVFLIAAIAPFVKRKAIVQEIQQATRRAEIQAAEEPFSEEPYSEETRVQTDKKADT